jgi:hypothetical protein
VRVLHHAAYPGNALRRGQEVVLLHGKYELEARVLDRHQVLDGLGQTPSWLEAAGSQRGQLVCNGLRRQQTVEHHVQGRQRKAELIESAAYDLEEGAPAAGSDLCGASSHAAAVSPVQRTPVEIT